MNCYSQLAEIYDALADDYDYGAWAAWYEKIMRQNGIDLQNAYILDAACGTGNMTVPLLLSGAEVIGMDISEPMLSIAGEKLRKNGLRAPLICRDIRDIALPRKANVITCACDGVNYLLADADAKAFFSAAYSNLKAGGLLLFDISSAYKLEHILGTEFYAEERDDVAYIWKNDFDREKRLLTMDITFFIREGELFRRETELHTQRAYEVRELTELLETSGFTVEGIYSGFDYAQPREDSMRIHFVARKA